MKNVFKNIHTIAVIGCSSNSYRTSHQISKYIQDEGFRLIPINPNETEVLGETCYNSVFDLPDDLTIDMFDIFRNKKYTKKMVEEIVKWSQETGQKPVIWTQLNVSTPEAKELAEEEGFDYIKNRCLMIEHRKLKGDI
ncbi:MAG TPA: CoA-binding protein [Balneolaceae bacterium]|nr:CoA-binding protein [Balneolaceae bacterium]